MVATIDEAAGMVTGHMARPLASAIHPRRLALNIAISSALIACSYVIGYSTRLWSTSGAGM